MSQSYKVTYVDGRVEEMHVIPSARRAFEAEHKMSVFEAISTGQSWWADELVWRTLSLRQQTSLDLEAWLLTVDKLEIERLDPTGGTGATPDESSTQQSTPDSPSTG